ncbi:hypothetical protein FRC04_004321 [Tulasnella sp. 424]|nr:hypothetical protein FRC04_004321 [Tulasnella sp. 424]
MVPQQTQCSLLSARTPAQLSQAAPLERDHTIPKASDDVIASPGSEHVADEVETLKDQLAASEALVKLAMKEKFEAIDASQKLWLDIQYLQEQQAEWEKEKKDLTAKLISREEEEATLVVSPPSEGVWFAGSSKERRSLPKAHSSLLSTTHLSQRDGNLKTPPAEELPVPQIIVSPPTDSDGHPEPEVNKRSKRSPRPSAGGETTNVYLSPPSDPPSPRSPWASTPSRRALLDALGLPCLPGSPLDLVEPQPTRSVSRPPPPQPDLNDLVSQTASVGKDIHLRSPERRVPHDRSKLPRAHGDGPASRRFVACLPANGASNILTNFLVQPSDKRADLDLAIS